jgi:putative SOS response-associated peptidase YedK
MCGRFGASFQFRDIKALWNLRGDLPGFAPRYNIAPSQEVPVIIRTDDRNEVKPMRWALVPLWVVLLLGACTTVPGRFTQDPSISDKGGYRVENETAQSFTLEVFYVAYSFFPNPDPAVQEARDYFIRVASEFAKKKGKKIVRPTTADLNASPTRNTVSGQYAVYVTGKVTYESQ